MPIITPSVKNELGENKLGEIIHADDSSDDDEVGAFYALSSKASIEDYQIRTDQSSPSNGQGFFDKHTDLFYEKKLKVPPTFEHTKNRALNFQDDVSDFYGHDPTDQDSWHKKSEWHYFFIALQLGINLLYDPKVEEKYQAYKKEFLGKSSLYFPKLTRQEVEPLINSFSSICQMKITLRDIALILSNRNQWLSFRISEEHVQVIRQALNENKISLLRQYLPQDTIFASTDIYEYFSFLRLCNRSTKRIIGSLREEEKKKDNIRYRWQLGDMPISGVLQINFDCSEENHKYSRTDRLCGIGDYSDDIVKKIISKKSSTGLSDRDIAISIRRILRHEPLDNDSKFSGQNLRKFLVNLTHLLFGVETMRSPESLIIHQMLLDVIITCPLNEECTWEYLLKEKKVAAFDKGAVQTMRTLTYDLYPYLSVPYYHPGPLIERERQDSLKKLYGDNGALNFYVKKQSDFMEFWRKLCYPRHDISEAISQAHKGWFGFTYPSKEKKILQLNIISHTSVLTIHSSSDNLVQPLVSSSSSASAANGTVASVSLSSSLPLNTSQLPIAPMLPSSTPLQASSIQDNTINTVSSSFPSPSSASSLLSSPMAFNSTSQRPESLTQQPHSSSSSSPLTKSHGK